jgi:hypothetical protein
MQYIKKTAKIEMPGSVGMLATARTPAIAGKPVKEGPPTTAWLKATARNANNTRDSSNNLDASNSNSSKQLLRCLYSDRTFGTVSWVPLFS